MLELREITFRKKIKPFLVLFAERKTNDFCFPFPNFYLAHLNIFHEIDVCFRKTKHVKARQLVA
jgi:hypothetical protein